MTKNLEIITSHGNVYARAGEMIQVGAKTDKASLFGFMVPAKKAAVLSDTAIFRTFASRAKLAGIDESALKTLLNYLKNCI